MRINPGKNWKKIVPIQALNELFPMLKIKERITKELPTSKNP